jgi:hypothetical protein
MSTSLSHHAEWLSLVEISGPFLSVPVLERAFPQGLDALDSNHASRLRLARSEWADSVDETSDNQTHDAWVRFVLTETLGYVPEVLDAAVAVSPTLTSTVEEHAETLRPDFALSDNSEEGPAGTRLLIQVYSPTQDLDVQVAGSRWAASPAERMTQLCRDTGVRLGLVVNGEHWMLIHAPQGETAAYVSWFASLWSQEPLTLRAFQSLLGVRRFFGVDESETLEALLVDSTSYQAEVTEQLGAQVRRAVEVLVQALDRADADAGRALLDDVSEAELYEAALTIMMRLVFMFYAEENDLLPLRDDLYQQNYAASTLRGQLREEADRVGIEVLERRQDAWPRLLATFRAIYAGIEHDALRLPAYGGSLFDPDRFPFLEGRRRGTVWQETNAQPLVIDNRTALHLLDALQVLQMRGRGGGVEARKLSFRALDIEQIGHVYEMLLDHEVWRADAPGIGIIGAKGLEPEVGLDELEEHSRNGHAKLLEFLQGGTKRSLSSLEKALGKESDPAWAERLRVACGDEDLLARVLPYQALIRTDPWGEPVVIREGSVFVTAGAERRSTGTYYTPRALTEEVVTHALEPLVYVGGAEGKPREEWQLRPPEEILELKVCDLAMGSGAFLVQVVRWLSERLVEAWDEAEAAIGEITIEGGSVQAAPMEDAVPAEPVERAALARRVLADRCVYGVDVNPLAVEMAKLSLWLITLAKGRPFSFLDHALKCGDSLLGVHDLDQIRGFHMDPARGRDLHATLFDPGPQINEVIDNALHLRRELESFTVRDVHDAEQKQELNRRVDVALGRARVLGDLIVGAAISTAGQTRDALDDKLRQLADRVPSMLEAPGTEVDELLRAEALLMLNAGKPALRRDRGTLHWPIEFPEVFMRERPGFDAIVGNPPFSGGKKISGVQGDSYREFLVRYHASSARGVADLVAYFFLAGGKLVAREGSLALLATNTISQGDTREVGLTQMVDRGWTVLRAWKNRVWPGDASVTVAVVWLHRGPWKSDRYLDGSLVPAVNAYLDPTSRVSGAPRKLQENSSRSFQGSLINGAGFLLTPAEAESLLSKNSANSDVLFPYLSADDVNSRADSSPSRWVINFFDWPLERAEQYSDCLRIVRERVKPHRDKVKRKAYRERWWRFSERAVDLYKAIAGYERVVSLARVSRTVTPALVDTRVVFSDSLVIFAYQEISRLGLLTSVFHWWWAIVQGSTLQTALRYTPTHCFETFPQPALTHLVDIASANLEQHRRPMMLSRNEGLTKTYNRVHDPKETASEVVTLRQLHVELDFAVAAAYGWQDLNLDHDFYETPQGRRFTLGPSVRTEILNRLSELNQERHKSDSANIHLAI